MTSKKIDKKHTEGSSRTNPFSVVFEFGNCGGSPTFSGL
jgi:hypothetical protein